MVQLSDLHRLLKTETTSLHEQLERFPFLKRFTPAVCQTFQSSVLCEASQLFMLCWKNACRWFHTIKSLNNTR
jgi:hypothetical protein